MEEKWGAQRRDRTRAVCGGLCLRLHLNLRLEPVAIPGSEHTASLRLCPVSAAFPVVREMRTQNRVNTAWDRKLGRWAGSTRIPRWRSWAVPVAHASPWELTGYLGRNYKHSSFNGCVFFFQTAVHLPGYNTY